MFNGSGILSKYSFNEYHFVHVFWLLLREMTSAKRNAHHFSKSGIAKLLIRYFFGLTIGPLYHLKTESTGNVNCSISWFSKEAFSKEANVFEKLRLTLIEGVLLKVFLLRKKLLYLLRGSGFRLISKLYYSKLFIRNRTWRYIDINIGPRRAFTVKKHSLFSIFKNLLGVLNFLLGSRPILVKG